MKTRILEVLRNRPGSRNGITALSLAILLNISTRKLRLAVQELRAAGQPICGTPETGYFWAETDAELNQTCNFLMARATTTLQQVAAMKRTAMPDLRGQLKLI